LNPNAFYQKKVIHSPTSYNTMRRMGALGYAAYPIRPIEAPEAIDLRTYEAPARLLGAQAPIPGVRSGPFYGRSGFARLGERIPHS
jgi:hypothetical protein